jgi:hypothetical protein
MEALKNNQIEEQELFNAALFGLRKQGQPSMVVGGPAYRAPNGCKCAVGHILSDEEYNQDMESKVVARLVMNRQFPERLVPHVYLLQQLQDAHDCDYCERDVFEWEKAMQQIAKERGLVYAPVQQ